MTIKSKKANEEGVDSSAVAASEHPQNVITAERKDGESSAAAIVRHAASPVTRGAITSRKLMSYLADDTDITTYVEKLREQTTAVAGGDLSVIESMLVAQALTLDALFNRFAMTALESPRMQAQEALLRLALKAQSQCASTAKVLGEIKNPRSVAFIRQQNNAAGHQQINNGAAATPSADPRARAEECGRSNGLLESKNGEWMDPGAPGKAGRSNQTLETMGAVNRADKRGG